MSKPSEHRPPPLCPLCGKNEDPKWGDDRYGDPWRDFARHVWRSHTVYLAASGKQTTCPCGWHDNDTWGFEELTKHLRSQPDVTEHLVLAAIAGVGRD